MGIDAFRNNPTAVSVSHFLECAIQTASATPKYIICDKGQQFWCPMRITASTGIRPLWRSHSPRCALS
jgi:hypothetical protein